MTARVTLKSLVDKSNLTLPGGQVLGPGEQVEVELDLTAPGHEALAVNNLITQKRLSIVAQGNDEVGYARRVHLDNQITGEDPNYGWLNVADGGYMYEPVLPLPNYSNVGTLASAANFPAYSGATGAISINTNSVTVTAWTSGTPAVGMVMHQVGTLSAGFPQGARVTQVNSPNTTFLVDQNAQAAVASATIGLAWPFAYNADQVLGTTGDVGDYLKCLLVTVRDPNFSQVILRDGDGADTLSMLTHGSTACLTNAIVTQSSFSGTASLYNGQIFRISYQPTGYNAAFSIKRKVVGHTTGASSTLFLDHPLPSVPGTAVACYLEAAQPVAYEVVPNGLAAGTYMIPVGMRSVNGAWKVSVDIGVQVVAVGFFS